MKTRILAKIDKAFEDKLLLESSMQNLKTWIGEDFLQSWALETIEEFLDKGIYEELNDRFFTKLALGTGGMRGKTMGKHTQAVIRGIHVIALLLSSLIYLCIVAICNFSTQGN